MPSITRAQGPMNGYSAGGTILATLVATPTQGNLLTLTYGSQLQSGVAYKTVSTITQTGVTWTQQAQKQYRYSGYAQDSEIWTGVVSAGASATVSIVLSASGLFGAVADICEYTIGSPTTWSLDQKSDGSNSGGGSDYSTLASTGTTASTTQANEVWIGATWAGGYNGAYNQTTPTNGFTLLDGVAIPLYIGSVAYLELIVTSKGTASSGTTISTGSNPWAGCITTFYPLFPSPSVTTSSFPKVVLNPLRSAYGGGLM